MSTKSFQCQIFQHTKTCVSSQLGVGILWSFYVDEAVMYHNLYTTRTTERCLEIYNQYECLMADVKECIINVTKDFNGAILNFMLIKELLNKL